MGKFVGLVFGAIGLGLVLILVAAYISASNTEIGLRNQASAQQEKNKVIYDKVWKILQQKAGVVDKYAGDFKAIFGNIMSERYQGDAKGAPLFKWITEHNPNFSVELYANLSDEITAQQNEFAMVQSRLLDINREHTDLRTKFPTSWFVGGRKALDIQIVTSTRTEKTFASGKDDNVDLFAKKRE